MKRYDLTMRIEADDDVSAEQIRHELYDATEDVDFAFDITSVHEVTQ
jgi:hypothetical protein